MALSESIHGSNFASSKHSGHSHVCQMFVRQIGSDMIRFMVTAIDNRKYTTPL